MDKIHRIVTKLVKALKQYDEIYIVSKKQYYNQRMGKVLSIMQLRKIITLEEYLKIHPDYKGKKNYFDETIMETFREVEILKELISIYEVAKNERGNGETKAIRT